ncbi:MAG: hypothetical protein DSZ04_03580 [Sulfurimonas sp.]|nr:MAG: hypothetical protein DSZ04_03580 [Sulfurimonas sp.]
MPKCRTLILIELLISTVILSILMLFYIKVRQT